MVQVKLSIVSDSNNKWSIPNNHIMYYITGIIIDPFMIWSYLPNSAINIRLDISNTYVCTVCLLRATVMICHFWELTVLLNPDDNFICCDVLVIFNYEIHKTIKRIVMVWNLSEIVKIYTCKFDFNVEWLLCLKLIE